MTAEPHKQSF